MLIAMGVPSALAAGAQPTLPVPSPLVGLVPNLVTSNSQPSGRGPSRHRWRPGLDSAADDPSAVTGTYRGGQVVVTFEPGASAAQRASARARIGAGVLDRAAGDVELLDVGQGIDTRAAIRRLERAPGVESVGFNGIATTDAPNDTRFGEQWAMQSAFDHDVDAAEAWAATDATLTATVPVAVVDTGVDLTHPDLANRLWTNTDGTHGYDFANNDADPSPLGDHGSHVAGIIGAERDNGQGIAGISKQARIMALAAGGGSFYDINLVKSFDWAASHGAKVVNGSFGGGPFSQALLDSINSHPDVLFVFAAGNDASNLDDHDYYPCTYPSANVVCVGAVDDNDVLAPYSNYSATNVDLFAPGTAILSTLPGGRYGLLSGTSMATPAVAGAAAAVRAANPTWTPAQVKTRLLATADRFGSPGLAAAGRLNLAQALSGAAAPLPPTAATATVFVVSGTLTYTAAAGYPNSPSLVGTGTTYELADQSTRLTPGAGCTALSLTRVRCTGVSAASVSTDDGDDTISADGTINVTANAGTGRALVRMGAGNDVITTGDLVDDIKTGQGNDTITAGAGNDTIDAGWGNDNVSAGAGNDALVGGLGNDTLDGGADDDTVTAAHHDGDDAIIGGTGRDSVSYAALEFPLRLAIGSTSGNGELGESDSLAADIEDVTGGSGDDTISGSTAANQLTGGPGSDLVLAGGGDDVLVENQTTKLGQDDDVLGGGGGIDRVVYDRPAITDGEITATIGSGTNDGASRLGERDFVGADVEGLEGGGNDDTLTGSSAANLLAGGDGSDTLRGGLGTDTFVGGRSTFPCPSCAADAGTDTVTYSERTVTVFVTVGASGSVDGDPAISEGENVGADIERVVGGSAGDYLAASAAGTTLDGGLGGDVLAGAGGNDTLVARDGVADSTIACGGGTDSVVYDTTDPAPTACESTSTTPTIEITGGVEVRAATNDSTPQFTFASPGTTGATFECKVESGTTPGAGAFAPCASPWSPATASADGSAVFSVRVLTGGAVRATTTRTFVVDTVPGDIVGFWPPTESTQNPWVEWLATTNVTQIECRLDAGSWGACGTPNSRVYGVANGPHILEGRPVDAAGNVGDTIQADWTTTIAPGDTLWGDALGNGATTSSRAPRLVFSSTLSSDGPPGQPTDRFECSIGTASSPWFLCSSSWKIPPQAESSTVLFRVRTKTATGLVDTTPASKSISFDYTAPDTQIATPAAGTPVTTPTATFTFTKTDWSAATFECKLDAATTWTACSSSYTTPTLSIGSHTLVVRAVDAAGNIDGTPVTRAFTRTS